MSENYARYINVVRDQNGNAVDNAEIRVYTGDSTKLAQLYDGAGDEVGQPLSTDEDGIIRNGTSGSDGVGFRVRGGRYRIEGSAGDNNLITMQDVLIGTGQGYDVAQLQAIANAGVYETENDGIEETSDGDFFWVPGPDSLELYRNNDNAAEEQDEYPNLQALEGIVDEAQDARDAAQQAGNVYETTQDGLDDTSDGEYFSVPDDGRLVLYRNNDGSADEVLRYAGPIGTDDNEVPTNADIAASLISQLPATGLRKSSGNKPAWTKTSDNGLEVRDDILVYAGSTTVSIAAETSITMPSLSGGTDYTIYALDDGTLEAVDADSSAPSNSRAVGGFHYFLDDQIAENSLWDLNYHPSAPSPRAMTRDPKSGVWGDIYMMDTDYGLNGYSRSGAQIADDSDRPIKPASYGGDGSSTYDSMSWWVAVDLATAAGKRLPSYQVFTSLAYGVVERQAVGSNPDTTQHQAGHRSDAGCEQITGVMWQWGADINGTSATGSADWQDIAEGRGDVYTHSIRSPLFGANWNNGSLAGSRASRWAGEPDNSGSRIGARGVCDHVNLQPER